MNFSFRILGLLVVFSANVGLLASSPAQAQSFDIADYDFVKDSSFPSLKVERKSSDGTFFDGATVVDANGVLRQAPGNQPRLDHVAGEPLALGLLVEGERTNFRFVMRIRPLMISRGSLSLPPVP